MTANANQEISVSQTSEAKYKNTNHSNALVDLFAKAHIQDTQAELALVDFSSSEKMAQQSSDKRTLAALQVLLEMLIKHDGDIDKVDRVLVDYYINQLDTMLDAQLDVILHHPEFRELESLWTSLKYLVDRTEFRANSKIDVLDVSRANLADDFAEASELVQSSLYQHVYVQEYDTPGGQPYAAMLAAYEFTADKQDMDLLCPISQVAAAAHCPCIASASPQFFAKQTYDEVLRIEDLSAYMERAEYINWNSLRNSEDARYIGLTLPRFLLRLPYGKDNPIKAFNYNENVIATNADHYLWGQASFAFAANLMRSFKEHGWLVNIRGPESGGKVERLPLHQYDVGQGLLTKIPSQVIIPETKELELARLGFIPLSYYKNSDYACFFSANSIQRPAEYSEPEATANSRINARLPYVFLSARLGHYLKVLQRENIGANKNANELEIELNTWLQRLVTKMNNPGPELAATHPLRAGHVVVAPILDNPGYYTVSLYAMPHFQVEGIDVTLSLVGQLPGKQH